jgi:uncharacterized protein
LDRGDKSAGRTAQGSARLGKNSSNGPNWFSGLGPQSRATAAAVVRKALMRPSVQVLPQTSADFHAALAMYEDRFDKQYSLTDCRSMVAMKSLGLTDVLTNDHHFTQEGFAIQFP